MRGGSWLLLLLCLYLSVCCLTACGEAQEEGDGEPVILVLASFEKSAELQEQVDLFNQSNSAYRIEVEYYERSTQPEEDGIARLQREIASGEGPDLINFGGGYTTGDIVGGYTEDLLPYLEAWTAEEGEDYFPNILEAFQYQGGLYAMPVSFTLQTFAGSREMLGEKEHWNIRELMDCYQTKEEGVILYPGETKKDVFGTVLTGSMAYYIDWENGTCRFDGEEFQKVMEFADLFPDALRIEEDFSVRQAYAEGKALLLPLRLSSIYDICKAGLVFEAEDITYIGFPVEGECGTMIEPSGMMLAISAGSRHREVCFDFISRFLDGQYQREIERGFPISQSALEEKLAESQSPEYVQDEEGNRVLEVKNRISFEGEEPVDIYCVTREEADTLLRLIGNAGMCTSNDYGLYSILLEEADSYFYGDKSLEEASCVMQGRASVYVSEKVK